MSSRLPPATLSLIIGNIVVFVLQKLSGDMLLLYFALWPWGSTQAVMTGHGTVQVSFHVWELVTYAFLHGGIAHIFFNMFALFVFAGAIENVLGLRRFLLYYLVCVVTAALTQLLVVRYASGGFYPTIGASGGVFGILLAFAMLFPRERLILLFPPVPMPAWVFVAGYAVLELFFGVTGTASGIAHFAHLGGMLGGLVLMLLWRRRLPVRSLRS